MEGKGSTYKGNVHTQSETKRKVREEKKKKRKEKKKARLPPGTSKTYSS